MALVGSIGASRVLLKLNSDLSGSTSQAFTTGASHGIVTRSKLVFKTQSKHDEKEISRRVVLRLITSMLASGYFVQIMLANAKLMNMDPPPHPSTRLLTSMALKL
ncbi:hypothetical protein LXL04_027150 [Taraxacum kok-saghyz]